MREGKILLYLFLLTLLFLLSNVTDAYKPLVQIGKPQLNDIAYSPDGRYLAVLNHSYLELLDAETMESQVTIDTQDYGSLRFSPDGSLIIILGSKEIQIWQTDSKTLQIAIPVNASVHDADFSPDGKYFAYTQFDSVIFWDIAEKKIAFELTGDPQPVLDWFSSNTYLIQSIEFHPNGKILAVASLRNTIALWNIESRKIDSYLKIDCSGDFSKILRFNHDGSLLAAVTSNDRSQDIISVQLFDMIKGGSKCIVWSNIGDIRFTADDRYLIVGEGDGYIGIYDLGTYRYERKQVAKRLPPSNIQNFNRVGRITIRPDGKRFATQFNDTRIYIWDAVKFEKTKTLCGWAQTYIPAAYLPKANHIVTGVWTNEIDLWDATTGELLATREFYVDVERIKASPDGKTFAIAVEGTVQVYDGSTLRRLQVFNRYGHSRELDFWSVGEIPYI